MDVIQRMVLLMDELTQRIKSIAEQLLDNGTAVKKNSTLFSIFRILNW